MGNVYIMRHALDDRSYISSDLNNPLSKDGIDKLMLDMPKILNTISNAAKHTINIAHSPKIRAEQTARILESCLLNTGTNAINLHSDSRLVDFGQGLLSTSGDYLHDSRLLKIARDAFYYQYHTKHNLSFHFGDKLSDSAFSEANDFVLCHGESQGEFLKRIYRLCLDMGNLDKDELYIFITHKSVCWRIQQIIQSLPQNIPDEDIAEPIVRHNDLIELDVGIIQKYKTTALARLNAVDQLSKQGLNTHD